MLDFIEGALLVVGGIFVAALILTVFVTWPAMLLFGAVHSFLPIVPAFGFWQTMAVVVLLHLILPGGSSTSSS